MRLITLSSEMGRRWLLGNSLLPHIFACWPITPFNSAWDFYGMQYRKLATIRISFLLRLIVVDVEPFLEIWSKVFSSEDWETRYHHQLDPRARFVDVSPLDSTARCGFSEWCWM